MSHVPLAVPKFSTFLNNYPFHLPKRYRMKINKYCSLISLDETTQLIYNALSDQFTVGNFGLKELTLESVSNLIQSNSANRNLFVKAGILLEDSVNETETLKNLIDSTDNDESLFILHINPTLDCNLHCWYCYENHRKESVMNAEIMGGVLSMVRKRLETDSKIRKFELSFFGGEPLLKFDEVCRSLITEIAEMCAARSINLTVGFTSNATLLDERIISFLSGYNVGFQITLDGDRESHDRTRFKVASKAGTFDTIIRNIKILTQNNIGITLRINYTSDNAESVWGVLPFLDDIPEKKRRLITFDFQRVWQDKHTVAGVDDTYLLIKEIRRKAAELGFAVSNSRTRNTVQTPCYGDRRNHILVNYDGKVYFCTARDFDDENSYGSIDADGNVIIDQARYEHRMCSKFSREACRNCRFAPRCGGGCRTQAVERPVTSECMYGYSEEDLDEFILELFEERFLD